MKKPEKIIDKSTDGFLGKTIWATITKSEPIEARDDFERMAMLANKINEIIDYVDSPKEDSKET